MPPLRTKESMPALTARQYELYEWLSELASTFGPLDWSIGPNGAQYTNGFANPDALQGLTCANCIFYQGGASCEIVGGMIDPDGLCKFWIIPEHLLSTSMSYEIAGADGVIVKRTVEPVVHKQVDISILETRKDGGRILISTPSFDRDQDRVLPLGGKIDEYLKNPIVQWGHNYFDPWATIGRTTKLEVTDQGLVAEFELRPAANDQDPQNIVLLLWGGKWVKTASIGFKPFAAIPNERGGLDFSSWGLLEWSIVPIPANQEALRLVEEAYPKAYLAYTKALKAGRVLSAVNEQKLKDARDGIDAVLQQLMNETDGMNQLSVEIRTIVDDSTDLDAAALMALHHYFDTLKGAVTHG